MILFFFSVSYSYPLELVDISYIDNIPYVNLLINYPGKYELALCYNKDLDNQEGWRDMYLYEDSVSAVSVELPKTGSFKLFYTFRLRTKEFYSFCQPFEYTKGGYKVVEKDYKKKMSGKKKEEHKKEEKKKEEGRKEEGIFDNVGILLLVFMVISIVLIFFSGGSQI
ncbi:putative SP-containing membrane protein [Vairimorpha necatrix]|uniref:SP-containing membrane protein n=1 Tax=Vairimorpha necatrix TaxID=6039 RepID=A0AAX4JD05_9MICR